MKFKSFKIIVLAILILAISGFINSKPVFAVALNSGCSISYVSQNGLHVNLNVRGISGTSDGPNGEVLVNWGDNKENSLFYSGWTSGLQSLGHDYASSGTYSITAQNTNNSAAHCGPVSVTVTVPIVCTEGATVALTGPSTINSGQTGVFHAQVANTGNTRWYSELYFQLIQKSNLNISPIYGHYVPQTTNGDGTVSVSDGTSQTSTCASYSTVAYQDPPRTECQTGTYFCYNGAQCIPDSGPAVYDSSGTLCGFEATCTSPVHILTIVTGIGTQFLTQS